MTKQSILKYDNAEESGYLFEKGRQRAQREAAFNHEATVSVEMQTKKKKKSPTWLWVIGWICIFPIPLTILMLRNKHMKPAIKYGIIALGWILYLIIGLSGAGNKNNNSAATVSSAVTASAEEATAVTESDNVLKQETAQEEAIEESQVDTSPAPTEEVFYDGDTVVNSFIAQFNSTQDIQITDIQKGNIRQKAYAYIGDVYIEMLDSYDAAANNYNMSIYGGNTDEKTEAMFNAFKRVAKVLDSSLTDEQIDEVIDSLKNGNTMVDDTPLGNFTIEYVPSVEISTGKTDSRIDVSSSTFAKP